MKEKKPESGPQIRRDENNQLDHDHADHVLKELQQRLITEQRAYQKDISFRNAKGTKRDVMMFITIVQRNSIDGKVVLGDPIAPGQFEKWKNDDPYAYKVYDYVECEMMAREIPMSLSNAGKFLMGCFKVVTNYLTRMNVIDRM